MKSKETTKRKMLRFVRNEIKNGKYPYRIELEKMFHIDLRQYFPGGIEELYSTLGINYTKVKEKIVKNRIKLAMQKRRRFPNKTEGRKVICRYIKHMVKIGNTPRYVDVEKNLKINVVSYFRNLKEAYEVAGITCYPWTPEKRLERKNETRKKVLEFVSKELCKGNCPKLKQVEKKFRIMLTDYFPKGIEEVYNAVGVNYHEIRKGILKKRIENRKKEIAKFIKYNVKQGIYVGHREITERLKLNLGTYFPGIKEAYGYAGIKYKKDPNPLISLEKQEKLRKISLRILKKLGFLIVKKRSTHEDVCVKDNKGNIIPVELKAYRHSSFFPNKLPYLNRDKKNEIEQVRGYMEKYDSPYGIIFTTTDKIMIKIPKDIKLFKASDILNLIQKFGFKDLLEDFNWIRNTYTSETKSIKMNERRRKIIGFFKKGCEKSKPPSMYDIQREFNIDIRTYFPGRMKELYQRCNVQLPPYLKEKN